MTNAAEVDISSFMNLRPVKNMSDVLYQKISGMILDGILPEGYIFQNEETMCNNLNIGRSTLREAYKALELSGYVTRSKRGGTVVNGREMILAATPLKKTFQAASKTEFSEFRLNIEVANANIAAMKAKPEDIAELKAICKEMEEMIVKDFDGVHMLQNLDRQFHLKIARMTENELFIVTMMTMIQVWDESVKDNFFNVMNMHNFVTTFEQHRDIVDALEQKDCVKARLAMSRHIHYVERIEEEV